tara:strand:- start:2028 stop:3266 length:1239 start_codon:yes stop_codon:yes gene_type:complete
MTVSIVSDKELIKQENNYAKCIMKLRNYPKKLLKSAIECQERFAVEFQKKFEKLKKAKIVLMEVDFDKIVLLQSRAAQFDSDNYELRTSEFKSFGFLTEYIFPIVVSGTNGMYDLITGYHRIKVFKEIFNMKKCWFIVFCLPDDVKLTAKDKRDMGMIANPKQPTGSKEFSDVDLAFNVVESAKEGNVFKPQCKKDLEKQLRPIVIEEINKFNYLHDAFGYMNDQENNKLKKDVLALALDSFDVLTPIDMFSIDDIDNLIKTTKKKLAKKVTLVQPKVTSQNWNDRMIRHYTKKINEKFELVCNFSCHGSETEYRVLQKKYYVDYVTGIITEAWKHLLIDYEMGYDARLEDFEKIIKYFREKINFKYFSPMHPDHPKNELILVKDEVDVDAIWENAKVSIERKYDDLIEAIA